MPIGGNSYLIDVAEAVFNGLLYDSVPDLVSPFEGLLMLHDDEL